MGDAADHRRMEETSMELGQLVDEAKLADIPVLVYGNKSDLMNAMEQCEIEESVARAQGAQLLRRRVLGEDGQGVAGRHGVARGPDQQGRVGSPGVPCLTFPP